MPKNARPKHLQARVSFLSQAAKFLAEQQFSDATATETEDNVCQNMSKTGLPLMLASHLRIVAKRSQVQIGRESKAAVCKVCSTPLLEGKTSTTRIVNSSKDGQKPWADIRTVTCSNCGTEKRFPIGAKRQQRKALRPKVDAVITAVSQTNIPPTNAALNAMPKD